MCECVLNKTLCTWVWLFLTSLSVAHQAPLSREFSRQEYWSGLPGPPPVYLPNPGLNPHLLCLLNWQMGSLPLAPPGKPKENMKWSEMKVTQSCLTLCNPMDCIVHGILQARILEWVAFLFSRGSSQPSDWTQVSCIAGIFLTSWVTGDPKNTGVGTLPLFQRICLTQELNRGLLHCRWILYQLSYKGNPYIRIADSFHCTAETNTTL